ncbi:MAG: aldo/keto reductase, partial [Scardovia wiggsiae]|nr:aldo/keto reductase [Scardovia wiggsiae]
MPEPLNRGASPETAIPQIILSDGRRIPQIGLGVLRIGNGDVSAVVRAALESGYRHIDTAQAYGNERGVGEGIRTCGIDRKDIFVTSKVAAENKSYASAT